MNWKSVTGWTAGLLICVGAVVANAQQPSAAELYGRGVSAYFSGDVASAVAVLDKAIKANPDDPRAYYFRGLANIQQGDADAAQADFAKGAQLETLPTTRVYDVDAALQRIQGTVRIKIENQRRAALRAAAAKKRQQDKVRYEQLQRREKQVLFDPDRPAPKINFEIKPTAVKIDPFATDLAVTGGKQVIVKTVPKVPVTTPDTPKPRDPFAAPTAKDPFGAGAPKPAAKPGATSDNPFGAMPSAQPSPDTKAPTTAPDDSAPAATDPFGIGGGQPAANVPPENSAAAPSGASTGSSESVVGTALGLLGKTLSGSNKARDPFGDAPAPAPAEDDKAASEPPPKTAPADDPFGSTPPKTDTPAPNKPASNKPASPPADDPFK